jgi:hypothetical protein
MAVFLFIPGIKGGTTEKNHEGWVKVDSLQFGVGRSLNDPALRLRLQRDNLKVAPGLARVEIQRLEKLSPRRRRRRRRRRPAGRDADGLFSERLFEELGARHVTHRRALCLLLLLRCVIERVPQKNVRIAVIARVTGHDRIKSFGESYFLHV